MSRPWMPAALASLLILTALTSQAQAPRPTTSDEQFDEMLVLGAGAYEESAAAFVRTGNGVWQRCALEGETSQLAHRTLVRGVIHRRTTHGRYHDVTHTCSVAATREVVAPNAHRLFPVDYRRFGPVDTRSVFDPESVASFAAQHLEVHQLEDGHVQWTALWASDLPDSIVIDGHPTRTSSEVLALLEEATHATRGREVRREELFAPEIPDRALRLSLAHARTFVEAETDLEVTPLCRGSRRDLRVAHFSMARDSTVSAWWRGVIRSAVLNHGARPWGAAACAEPSP